MQPNPPPSGRRYVRLDPGMATMLEEFEGAAIVPRRPPWSLFMGIYHERRFWGEYQAASLLRADSWFFAVGVCELAMGLAGLPSLHRIFGVAIALFALHITALTMWQTEYARWRVPALAALKVFKIELMRFCAMEILSAAAAADDAAATALSAASPETHFRLAAAMSAVLAGQVVGMQLPTLLHAPLQGWAVVRLAPQLMRAADAAPCGPAALPPPALLAALHRAATDAAAGAVRLFAPGAALALPLVASPAQQACAVGLLLLLAIGCAAPLALMYCLERRHKRAYLDALRRQSRTSLTLATRPLRVALGAVTLWFATSFVWLQLLMRLELCSAQQAC